MYHEPQTCRRPGQAATEQRSTLEAIVTPELLFSVGLGTRLLPEIGSDGERDPNYELLNRFTAWRTNCIFRSQVGLIFQRLTYKATGVASWFSSMPRRDAGHFYSTPLQIVFSSRTPLRCCITLESV